MDKDLIAKVQEWVEKTYSNAEHLVRTGYWVKKIYPEADDALIIAAISHDIERAFNEGRTPPSSELKGAKWDDPEYDKWHSERSAKFVSDFLENEGAGGELIKEVAKLVGSHEHGGWKEADILRDADSLSFLEVNAPVFISWIPNELSAEDVKGKFDFMYKRIGGKEAKQLAKPLYEKALEDLAKINN
jgi:hypothetical protein